MSTDISNVTKRLQSLDTSLWSSSPEIQKSILNRLGWFKIFQDNWFSQALPRLQRFSSELKKFPHQVLLGMGGSSLCADVLRRVTGAAHFHVLDSTHPEAILALEKRIPKEGTLFIVASKSGSTLEVDVLKKYFTAKISHPGQFVAITDPGSPLEKEMSVQNGFLEPILNPADIGGRYSALSMFGLVPAMCMNLNLEKFIQSARRIFENLEPAVRLGLEIGQATRKGTYHLAFELPETWQPLSDWIEQLVAESTGKNGVGVLPLTLGTNTSRSPKTLVSYQNKTSALNIDIHDVSPEALGGEFLRWQVATASCSHVLGINAFDEPHVRLAKEFTQQALQEPAQNALAVGTKNVQARLKHLFADIKPDEYIAVLAFLKMSPAHMLQLENLQNELQDRYGVSCTVGFGPRYLHSTGQFHKGGPLKGRFVIITDEAKTLSIPNTAYDFSQLVHAQALGDLKALQTVKQRVEHVHVEEFTHFSPL